MNLAYCGNCSHIAARQTENRNSVWNMISKVQWNPNFVLLHLWNSVLRKLQFSHESTFFEAISLSWLWSENQ